MISRTDDLRVHALASGSSGNAFLVQCGDTNVLIDAGIGIRLLASHLRRFEVGKGGLAAILLTHEHTDHAASAVPASYKYDSPLVANDATLAAVALRSEKEILSQSFATGSVMQIGPLSIQSFPVSHDAVEPVGFVISVGDVRVCYATDVGCVDESLREAIRAASLVVLESNHDEEWLWRGPYTQAMKQRVASDTGHLSNRACAELLGQRALEGTPFTAWLAHLSRVNNSPSLARRTALAGLSRVTTHALPVEVALRDHPSVMWRAGRQAVQLSLF